MFNRFEGFTGTELTRIRVALSAAIAKHYVKNAELADEFRALEREVRKAFYDKQLRDCRGGKKEEVYYG